MRPRNAIILIAVVALAPRLILWGINIDRPERWMAPDSHAYRNLGRNLIEHGVLSQRDVAPFEPDFDRTATYPLFLAGVFAVAGGVNLPAAVFAQILLSVATCLILYGIARRVVGERWALAAGLAQALSLSAIATSQYILTECVFTFLLAIQLWLAYEYREKGRVSTLIAATAVLGAMTHCRPISLLWILPQSFMLLCETRIEWGRRIGRVAIGLLVFVVVLSPRYVRNRALDGAWFFSTTTGYTLLRYHAVGLEARLTGEPGQQIRERIYNEVEAEFAAHPDKYASAHAQNAYRKQRAVEIVKRAPFLYFRMHFHPGVYLPRINSFFELIGMTQGERGTLDVLLRKGVFAAVRHYFGGRAWLILLVAPWIALLGLIYLGAAVGVVRWLLDRDWISLLFFLAFVPYYTVLPGPAGEPRFREAAMPMLILAAATGLRWIGTKIRTRVSALAATPTASPPAPEPVR